jgi:hypothetical protein
MHNHPKANSVQLQKYLECDALERVGVECAGGGRGGIELCKAVPSYELCRMHIHRAKSMPYISIAMVGM